jgi:dolichol-phosphate mannosyltransferase
VQNVCVVVPTYNERPNVLTLIGSLKGLGLKVIVVDDNSPDGTADLVSQAKIPSVFLIRRNERGLGSAIKRGMEEALNMGCERIVTMDADLSHDPKYLPDMLGKDCDLVIGSRYIAGGGIENWPLIRRIISSGANIIARTMLRTGIRDNTSNFRVYSTKAVREALKCESASGYEFQICALFMVRRAGLGMCEFPITFVDRKMGKSKLGAAELIKWLVYVVRLAGKG